MLDDRELQKAISKREVVGVTTVSRSVLDTRESPDICKYRTTISYFFHEGTMYSDAISAPADPDAPLGYWPFKSDEINMPCLAEPQNHANGSSL